MWCRSRKWIVLSVVLASALTGCHRETSTVAYLKNPQLLQQTLQACQASSQTTTPSCHHALLVQRVLQSYQSLFKTSSSAFDNAQESLKLLEQQLGTTPGNILLQRQVMAQREKTVQLFYALQTSVGQLFGLEIMKAQAQLATLKQRVATASASDKPHLLQARRDQKAQIRVMLALVNLIMLE